MKIVLPEDRTLLNSKDPAPLKREAGHYTPRSKYDDSFAPSGSSASQFFSEADLSVIYGDSDIAVSSGLADVFDGITSAFEHMSLRLWAKK